MELYPTDRRSLEKGNFPLDHDCILKVIFIPDAPLRFQYFSCREQDSGQLIDLISKVGMVFRVNVTSVDKFNYTF